MTAPASALRLTDDIEGNPVVGLAWPRPDFQLAALEFLIGLLATAFSPRDLRDWLTFWRQPPTPARLEQAFAPYRCAFNLDGPGPPLYAGPRFNTG